jgi:predicted Rossmann fold nucleotide-binding protein DprA/Smf involved in DNA uptake
MNQVQQAPFPSPGDASVSASRTLDLLSLSLIRGLGDEGIGRLLAECRRQGLELAELYRSPVRRLREQFKLHGQAAEWVANNVARLREQAAALLERALELCIVVLAPGDPAYPGRVEQVYDGQAPLLYARGDLGLLESRCIALLNSTPATADALEHAFVLARRLAEAGLTLVTSTEGPSYNLVASGARQADAPLVVVAHRSLFEVLDGHPERDPLPLARRLDATVNPDRMLLLSPFRLNGRWQKGNGPRRDHLVAALAETLIGVQLRSAGTMELLCRKAQTTGRRLFICEYARPPVSRCVNQVLIRDGATPLVPDSIGSNIDVVLKPPAALAATRSDAEDLERRRALGQFFTPPVVARFMLDMVSVFRGRKLPRAARVIDPACGEGVFLRTAVEHGKLAGAQLFGVDIDETLLPIWHNDALLKESRLFRANGLLDNPAIDLLPGSFDLVIGNPPFSGKGLKDLLRLIDQPRGSHSEPNLFGPALRDEPQGAGSRLSPHERPILDGIVRQLSPYDCWQHRDEPDEDVPDEFEGEPEQKGLFADLALRPDRAVQAGDYDRLARLISDWPANQLLDVNRPEVRETIRRLASVAIEVFFTERFVQLVKPGGMVALIVPESILASDQLALLRRWLLERLRLYGVVSLPQKVFTGVGAKAKTGILFARRLTQSEQRATRKLKPLAAGIRMLPRVQKAKVVMVSPNLNWPEWSLEEYLADILASTVAKVNAGAL